MTFARGQCLIGYATPQNLQVYALYLDSRIRAYKDLKHDVIRVQAESNRDMRNSASIEEDGYRGRKDRSTKPATVSVPTRSKTIMGRKLRSMTVEKGLLRETKVVHGMIDTLVECRVCLQCFICFCALTYLYIKFYLDDLEDELTTTALRMLVKDLLILFQAGNEGVINVLGKMSFLELLILFTQYGEFTCRKLLRNVSCGCQRGSKYLPSLL